MSQPADFPPPPPPPEVDAAPPVPVLGDAVKVEAADYEPLEGDVPYKKAAGSLRQFMADGKLKRAEIESLYTVDEAEQKQGGNEYYTIAKAHREAAAKLAAKNPALAERYNDIAELAEVIDRKITKEELDDGELKEKTKALLDQIDGAPAMVQIRVAVPAQLRDRVPKAMEAFRDAIMEEQGLLPTPKIPTMMLPQPQMEKAPAPPAEEKEGPVAQNPKPRLVVEEAAFPSEGMFSPVAASRAHPKYMVKNGIA